MGMLFRRMILLTAITLLVSSEAYALSLGSLAKGYYTNMSAGETANFKILFWNTDKEPYDIEITAEGLPEGWSVKIDPEEFSISNNTGEETIKLPYTDESTLAKAVYVSVETNEGATPGLYDLTLKARTILPPAEAENFKVVPERIFNFQIEIEGKSAETTERPKEENEDMQFYPLVIGIILIISIVLYKKYNK